jgi:hypothetical protein
MKQVGCIKFGQFVQDHVCIAHKYQTWPKMLAICSLSFSDKEKIFHNSDTSRLAIFTVAFYLVIGIFRWTGIFNSFWFSPKSFMCLISLLTLQHIRQKDMYYIISCHVYPCHVMSYHITIRQRVA